MALIAARVRNLLGCLVVAPSVLACSFVFERPPGTANEMRADSSGRRCGKSLWFPVVDTGLAVTSATWVLRANSELETHGEAEDAGVLRAKRIAGWVGVGMFGASAIYGYVVEAHCAGLRSAASAPPPPAAPRPAFPASVYGFGFRMQQPQLAQLCRSKGALWTMEGATGSCKPTLESSATPEVRITFQLGVPSQISTIYTGSVQTRNRDYQALADGLRKSFGPPQVEASRLSPECQASLTQCLQSGARPVGPVWHWAAGTIELVPMWAAESESVVLDIRYTPEEAQASQ